MATLLHALLTGAELHQSKLSFEINTLTDDYIVTEADNVLLVDTATIASASALTLPAPANAVESVWLIKDVGGQAASHPITLNRSAGGSIEGSASNYVISTNYAAIWLLCDGTDFWIM